MRDLYLLAVDMYRQGVSLWHILISNVQNSHAQAGQHNYDNFMNHKGCHHPFVMRGESSAPFNKIFKY